ncbi:MAG: hypothetical protein WCO53_10900, partial [Deltaproteobacteria bacterium]
TFIFDKHEIKFKRVSYSFPKTKKIRMVNTSEVPFTFQLKIPGDGKIINQKAVVAIFIKFIFPFTSAPTIVTGVG